MTVADFILKLLCYPCDMDVKVCVRPRVEPAASIGIDSNTASVVIYGDKPYNIFKEVAAVENYKA